ncbi:MAG TPA: asparaginase, partial [Cryptosporangiaceae bacterium]|nr:asparaginase [Cryptosporangiaceae bacterium]
ALPLDADAARDVLAAGDDAAPVLMNCSGKHAAMLRTCLGAGWPVDGYLDRDHPLQLGLRATIEELAGEPVTAVGVDGCGAPVFAVSLTAVARAFGALATAAPNSAERRVSAAMRTHPELVGGTGRDVTQLMAGVPGLVAKDGAEGVYAAAVPDVGAVAVKIADGAARARMPVIVAALRLLGVQAPVLDDLARVPVLSGGKPVGYVNAVWPPSGG